MKIFLSLMLFAFSLSSFADPTVTCYRHYHQNNYEKAFPFCELSAKSGRGMGSYLLGLMYAEGLYVEQNTKKSFELIKYAAESGVSDAQRAFGMLYQHGIGVNKDMKLACDWWEKSAHNRNFLGREYTGLCYAAGNGRPKDLVKGLAYMMWSKKTGNDNAASKINYISRLLDGEGISQAKKLLDKMEDEANH